MAEITIVPGSFKLIKMTDAEYFSKEYKGYVSNSRLGLINPQEGGSPEKYEAGFDNAYSDSFELGSAIHASILQPDFYNISDINKPTGKLGVFSEEVFKLRQQGLSIAESIKQASLNADYYSGKLSANRLKTAIKQSLDFYLKRIKAVDELGKTTLFLSSPIATKHQQIMTNVTADSQMMDTLYPKGLLQPAEFYNEYAILCEVDLIDGDSKIRIKLKAKLDNFTIDHEMQVLTLNDLKTSGKPIGFFMGNNVRTFSEETGEQWVWYNGSFQKYHYYRQMGMYLWLLQCAVKEIYGLNYKTKANMLVVETIPEFKCKVYPVNGKQIKVGLEEFKELLIMVAKWNETKSQI